MQECIIDKIANIIIRKKQQELLNKPINLVDIISDVMKDLEVHKEKNNNYDLQGSQEGLAIPSIETNKAYPIPAQNKKKNPLFDPDSMIGEDSSWSGQSIYVPKFDLNKNHFPPDPDNGPEDWPYDQATVTIMDPHSRMRKRSLTTSKEPKRVAKKKDIFSTDLRINQTDRGAGGAGIYGKSIASSGNGNMPGSGTSFSDNGVPGWSSSLSDKEFQLPDELEVSPVGSGIPTFSPHRNPGRRLGFRRR